MGVKQLRDTFNVVAGDSGMCMTATLGYRTENDAQWQILTFSGKDRNGRDFTVQSAKIRPNGDVIVAARDTARKWVGQFQENQRQSAAASPAAAPTTVQAEPVAAMETNAGPAQPSNSADLLATPSPIEGQKP